MLALPGILLLVVFTYVRPQEFMPGWDRIPWLYIWNGMAVLGLVADVLMGHIRLQKTPALPFLVGLWAYALLSVAYRNSSEFVEAFITLSVSLTLYFLVAHGVRNIRTFQLFAMVMLTAGLFLSFIGVHQGMAPWGCIRMIQVPGMAYTDQGEPDGRPCEEELDCYDDAQADPESDYSCERVGLFGTFSTGHGRVRWRGILQDPNELSLTIGAALPFSFALYERKRNFFRLLVVIVVLVMAGLTIVYSQSRGGQLVFAAVLGAYFIKRYGYKGALLGALAAVPLVAFGGRQGLEADASANERTECMAEGLIIWRTFFVLGCGYHQFGQHHFLTAHNSYLLAIAELGPFGYFLWLSALYISFKIPWTAIQHQFPTEADDELVKPWAMAMIASLSGLAIGIFFLSFAYHFVLWMYLGVAGALYCGIRTVDPTFKVKYTWKDAGIVVVACIMIVIAMMVYVRSKNH